MTNTLEQLKAMTTVVADTGDISSIETFQPVDATTNPSLLLKAATLSQYSSLINDSLAWAKSQSDELSEQVSLAVDALAVNIGKEILSIIPGRISTEVDARLSFDTQATIDKAKSLISLYQSHGIDTNRVLIKIASTWEGIQAAKVLEQQGINCNLTLLFNFAQARACAEAGVFLISPFVGRILDWHKTRNSSADFNGANDPGVQSVTSIYQYYKQHQYDTVVMGASFRNVSEVLELAGCDRLTISPALLEELSHMSSDVERKLNDEVEKFPQPQSLTESEFRWQLNQDPMATEKLAEGIRNFAADQEKLEQLLTEQL